jgi:hypothetical protein
MTARSLVLFSALFLKDDNFLVAIVIDDRR